MEKLTEYHISIGQELIAAKDRVRSLLHPSIHWNEDGRFKEEILKQVVSRNLPDTVGASSGFVRLRDRCTNQIDLLLVDKTKPSLFRTDGFTITTPTNVLAIVEVKTRIGSLNELETVLEKLADNTQSVRLARAEGSISNNAGIPWTGLFVFEEMKIKPEKVLALLDRVAGNDVHRIIQCICLGENSFFRYWPIVQEYNGEPSFSGWESYRLDKLAFSYFIGNLIWQDSPSSVDSDAWFALREGKAPHRTGQQALTLA